MTVFCQQLKQTESSAVNLSSLFLTPSKATTSRFVRATCGSVCVGSIAHPQQSRGPSLTWAID